LVRTQEINGADDGHILQALDMAFFGPQVKDKFVHALAFATRSKALIVGQKRYKFVTNQGTSPNTTHKPGLFSQAMG
jgi:hypothetical protein